MMNPFDNTLPEEDEPEYKELTTLLQQAYSKPVSVTPDRQAQILARVRERLGQTDQGDSLNGNLLVPQPGVLDSIPHQAESPAGKPRRDKRRLRLMALLAAAMIVAVLLGTPLLLLRPWLLSTGSATQTYASFVATNGIMFGFDAQHTHFNPFEHMLNPATVGGLTKKWAYPLGGTLLASPVVAGGTVYLGCTCGYLYALDAVTGAKKWAYATGGSQAADVPAVVGGVVYFGSLENHTLYALNAATGKKKWAYQTTGPIDSSPAVAGGGVYFGSWDGNMYALDAATGAKKWAYHTGNGTDSSPAVAGDVVYVGAGDGNVYALDAATGTKKWAYRIGGPLGPAISSPAVAGGVVYVGARDGNVYALDAATGTKKWIFPLKAGTSEGCRIPPPPPLSKGTPHPQCPKDSMSTDPVLAGGLVYFGSFDGFLYALDASSGTEKWAYRGDGSTISCAPVVADGVVYYGILTLYALHLPGT